MLDEVFGDTETMATFRAWVPRVARYSFATSRLTARPLVAA